MIPTHEIDDDILIIRQNGSQDASQLQSSLGAAFTDPALKPGFHLLWDATDAPAQASPQKMDRFLRAMESSSLGFSGRMAFLVRSELQYGVSRMFSAFADGAGLNVSVFYDIQDAVNWLRET